MSIFDAYLRGRQGGSSLGQNAFAMRQAGEKIQKDRAMRNAMAQAYAPSLPQAPAMGPTQPGETLPAYPEQQGGIDTAMLDEKLFQGGFGPEAIAMKERRDRMRGVTPSSVSEYLFRQSLTPEQDEDFLIGKRGASYLDTGSGYVAPSMADPTQTRAVVKRELKPTETPSYIAEKAEIAVTGKLKGEAKGELAELEASLPRLRAVVSDLSKLGKVATYTKAGQATDIAARQLGVDMPKGAIARKEYISKVDNEVLPLLRQTFGAAFTVEEGKSLRATLGDPDASPEEKDAVLRSFIDSKIANIETKRRRVEGVSRETADVPKVGAVQDGYIYLGGDPSSPESWKQQ